MKYARIEENTVVEIVEVIQGFTIEQCFHPDLVAKMVSCSNDVEAGWQYKPETGQFSEDGNFPALFVPEPPPAITRPTDTQTPQT